MIVNRVYSGVWSTGQTKPNKLSEDEHFHRLTAKWALECNYVFNRVMSCLMQHEASGSLCENWHEHQPRRHTDPDTRPDFLTSDPDGGWQTNTSCLNPCSDFVFTHWVLLLSCFPSSPSFIPLWLSHWRNRWRTEQSCNDAAGRGTIFLHFYKDM